MQNSIISLDVGQKRVGVARANAIARLASPLTTLIRGDVFWDDLGKLIADESADLAVIGLPRNLSGDDTQQTQSTREFIAEFRQRFDIPVETQDEALTSRKAEKELKAKGKKYVKGDIDALAATYILEDYLHETN